MADFWSKAVDWFTGGNDGSQGLGGFVNRIGSGFGGFWNRVTGSTEMNKKTYDQNFEMWNKNNAYNDPSAQMKRLTDAGVNPLLAFGDSASSGMSSGGGAGSGGSGGSGGIQQMVGIKSALAGINNVKADTLIKSAQAKYISEQTKYIHARGNLTDAQIEDMQNAIDYYNEHKTFRESDFKKGIFQMFLNYGSGLFK